METIIVNEGEKHDWEGYIEENPYSIAWQSYDWSHFLSKHYKMDFYPIAAYDNSKICGILPLYHLKNFFGKDQLISVPYAVAGGIVADSDKIAQFLLKKAIALSQQLNNPAITLKQYKVEVSGNLRTDENYYNRELDLTKNLKELWEQLSDTNKENIENANKYNLVLEYPSSNIKEFYKLLLKHHQLMGIPCVSRKWIENLIAFKMYFMALLKKNGEIVAGTLIKRYKNSVSFPFTCIPYPTPESNMFAYSLYWKLIEKFASEGMEIFHSGRIPKTDITNEYRLGWGGRAHNYYYQYYPSDGKKTEYSKRRGKKRDVFVACWRKLPTGLARILGPRVARKFP